MRELWAATLMILLAALPGRASTLRELPSDEAQIYPVSAPGVPFEPSSPERTDRPVAPFVVEVVHARVLAAAATRTIIVTAPIDPHTGAHERRIERPPIASPSAPS